MTDEEPSRIYADKALLEQIKKKYPEAEGMTYTGEVDWALRKLLELKKEV